jgi:hypothetical protein
MTGNRYMRNCDVSRRDKASDDAIRSQLGAQPAREYANVRRRRPDGRGSEPVEFAGGDPFGEWRAHKIGLEGVGGQRRPSHRDALPRDRRFEAQRSVRIDRPGQQGKIRASPRRQPLRPAAGRAVIAYDGKTTQILKTPYLRRERRATDREEFQSSQFLYPYVRPRPRPDANAGVDVGDLEIDQLA